MAADQIDVLLLVVAALEKLQIRYVIGGSFASSVHGFARATMDVNLVAAIKSEQVKPLAADLQPDFYADEQAIKRAVGEKRRFNLIHLDSMFKVDVFTKLGGFEQQELERRQSKIVKTEPQRSAFVATPEDVILAKLRWYRRGNEISDQQWKDTLGVIKVQADRLDLKYLRHWAQELSISDLLERALTECSIDGR